MKNKISIVINTYNASETLEETLKSVKGFDEVLVCDMESTDATVEIAKSYGCEVVTFPKANHRIVEPARDFAVHAASNGWVLVVDADELVTTELRDYLYERIKDEECPSGLFIPRLNSFMGRRMRATYPDYQLRFLKQEDTHWPPTIHSLPEVKGKVEKLPRERTKLALIHKDPNTIASRISKINSYSDYEVEKKKHRRFGIAALVWRPFFMFVKYYFLKGGILDGLPGFMWAIYEGIYQFAIVGKCIEEKARAAKSTENENDKQPKANP